MIRYNIKYNVLFFVDKEGTKATGYKPNGKLRLRIRWKSGTINFNVGFRVELAKWNTETQRCINGTTHGKKKTTAHEINSEIQRLGNIVEKIFTEFQLKETTPTTDEFREQYNLLIGKANQRDNETSFFDVYDMFVNKESVTNNWRYPTIQKFSTVRTHLQSFDKNISFDDWNKDKLNEYVAFLRDEKSMRNSTIKKQLGFLKWFLKWSAEEKYHSNFEFLNFKPKLENGNRPVVFLDWDELMTVYHFDFKTAKKKVRTLDGGEELQELAPESIDSLEKMRDVFCFMCFTSLRFSDAFNLRRTDVQKDKITVTTIKTSDTLTIELNDYSKAILDKYKNVKFPGNKALPVISMQKTNDHLKEIGELCELNTPITITYYKGAKRFDEVYPKYELLSTHAGRRTFICNALAMGIAPQTVMEFSGHSSYQSMKPYISVADNERKKAMELFNQKK